MSDTSVQLSHNALEDEQELSRLGYAQELFRTMGGFSNFALSFSIISILTGAVTLYGHGLTMGGPAEMAFGWPLVTLFTLTVALSMAVGAISGGYLGSKTAQRVSQETVRIVIVVIGLGSGIWLLVAG